MTTSTPQLPINAEQIPLEEVEPGDLIFLKPLADDPVSQLVVALDGGLFSHVGMVAEKQTMISARRNDPLVLTPSPPYLDLGGILTNPIVAMMSPDHKKDRHPHIARLKGGSSAGREALAYMTSREDERGEPSKSEFSYLKLFLVATALQAFKHGPGMARRAIFESARRAGAIWSVENEMLRGRRPSWFCSELVATAMGKTFTIEEFVPHKLVEELDTLTTGDHPNAFTIGLDGQVTSVVRVIAMLAFFDPKFLEGAIKSLLEVLPHTDSDAGVVQEGLLPLTGTDVPDGLPTALVTPRMIASMDCIEWIREVKPLSSD